MRMDSCRHSAEGRWLAELVLGICKAAWAALGEFACDAGAWGAYFSQN